MNERIEELAEQAKKFARKQMAHTMDPKLFYAKDFERKFAELIIKECMEVANTYQNRGGNCYVDDMIAKHFGIEE